MVKVKHQRSVKGEAKRIASLPRGTSHWKWSKNPTVLSLHRRLHRKYGRAKNFLCVACSKQAHDWALIGKKYTDNKDDYQPMCRKCHIAKDGNSRNGVHTWKVLARDKKGKFKKSS